MDHRTWLAEAVGTFLLVLVAVGSAAVDERLGGALGPWGLSLATGGIVALVIYSLGGVSGAHINPAVSLGFFLQGKLSRALFAAYLSAQVAGSVLAALLVLWWLPEGLHRGLTLPQTHVAVAFGIEVAATLVLVGVILETALGRTWPRAAVALCVGFTVAALCLIAGDTTGASMNPARSIGPALAAGRAAELWLYLLAPALGALLAATAFSSLRGRGAPTRGRDNPSKRAPG